MNAFSCRKRGKGFERPDGKWVSPYMASLCHGLGVRLGNPRLKPIDWNAKKKG